jgi:hypothetical protein
VVQPPTKSSVWILLLKYHPYRRVVYVFNGKLERTQRPKIMTLIYWIRAYDTKKEKEMEELFDTNGEPMFDDPEFFDTLVEKMSIGMKRKFVFYELPYWEHLKIGHLLDPMHIFKNVSSSLPRHISSIKSNTLAVRKDIIALNTKKRHCPRRKSKG